MIHRKRVHPPAYVYPPDEWKIVEKRFYPSRLAHMESIFAVSNGYLGMRGSCEEGRPVTQHGTFINGFYESWPIVYGEEAFGFAQTGQTMVNVPDSKIIRLYVDDEPFYLPTANRLHFERALDMQSGTLDREVLWETPSGKQVSIKSQRLVSFQHRHLAAICYEVTLLNDQAPVVISSEMINRQDQDIKQEQEDDPRKSRVFKGPVLLPEEPIRDHHRIVMRYRTRSSGMTLACGMDHVIETECPYTHESKVDGDAGKVVFSIEGEAGKPIRIIKYMTYHNSRGVPTAELCERAGRGLDRARRQGFDELLKGQRAYLDDFWRRSDIEVRGNSALQQAIRFNLFHLIQAAGRAEGAGLPAKGLTGEGYEGHYFWDAEIYILPFLIYTSPRIAENLLRFRYSMLKKARERATEVNQKGALFPWRTINGDEASAYYAAGTAQYHINADIMYTMRKYIDVTGDQDFLHECGAEMLVETARLWMDLGFYSKRQEGKFCIHGVTGPDEYNTVVNNNTFTNLMARENLWYAAVAVSALAQDEPDRFARLTDKTGCTIAEAMEWQRAADQMFIPFDEAAKIHPQDDSFLEKEAWDFENTPQDHYPLLLHYHPLVIYRHQVIKQADVVLAMFLLGNEFSLEQKQRNFDYYDGLTTGDSSLSASIQSILAFEIGNIEKAREYAEHSLLMDLADIGGNVEDGLHMASMGGTWMALVYGFAGLRDYDGHLSFRPRLPERIDGARFRLTTRGRLLELNFDRTSVTYSLVEGEELDLRHEDEIIRLTREAPVVKKVLADGDSQKG